MTQPDKLPDDVKALLAQIAAVLGNSARSEPARQPVAATRPAETAMPRASGWPFREARPVKTLPLSPSENVVVGLQTVDGVRLIDVRVHSLVKGLGSMPSDVGFAIPLKDGKAYADAFMAAVSQAEEEATSVAGSPIRSRRF